MHAFLTHCFLLLFSFWFLELSLSYIYSKPAWLTPPHYFYLLLTSGQYPASEVNTSRRAWGYPPPPPFFSTPKIYFLLIQNREPSPQKKTKKKTISFCIDFVLPQKSNFDIQFDVLVVSSDWNKNCAKLYVRITFLWYPTTNKKMKYKRQVKVQKKFLCEMSDLCNRG